MTDLPQLYKEMAELTEPECAKCRAPYSCCSPEYCAMAKEHAKERGVTLPPQNHPTLPYLGPEGCVVPPHLRPLCTLHTCDVSSLGFKRNDPEWTERYFALREQITAKAMEQ